MNTAMMIASAFFLVLLNAIFVAAEFAFVKVRPTRLELLAKTGHSRAQVALFGLNNLEDYLSVCQLGITLASLGLGWLGEPAVASLLRPALAFFGLENPTLVHSLSVVTGFVIITFIHVTFGELAPKNLSIRGAEWTCLWLAFPMRFFHLLFLPFVKILNFSATLILWCFRASHLHESTAHSTEELKLLIAESKSVGQLDATEETLLNNIFNMDRRVARDIMVHRTKVVALPIEASPAEAIELIRIGGFTRIPVYQENKDNPIGFIHAKDLLLNLGQTNIKSIVRTALSIYDHMTVNAILELMREKRTRLGLVWDEYGSFQGLVTMEDILEAIVGEIQDEFDHEEPTFTLEADGSVLVLTTVSLDELGRFMELDLGPDSQERYRTLAAILGDKFGQEPILGATYEAHGAKFEVDRLSGLAVTRVRVSKLPQAQSDSGA
ncbi:MAG: hemolysin family protein [Deltaproteobacteria bacterium]|jgi:CBS domain containing-hemolysin-like protein|nr:hemolysin family protein [Deltaproteobacteria bacterium]